MNQKHISVPGSLEPDDDGWYFARCKCGWSMGPLPDAETVTDALMAHVLELMVRVLEARSL